MKTHTEWKKQIQKIRQPTAYCQACLGQKVEHNDFMLACSICQASIHKTHYASEIIGKTTNQNHLVPNIQEWKCQRCRYLLQKKFQVQIKCQFCPSPRGIMKKVIFEPVLNNRRQIWVHPQCTTWCHPMIYMKSKKRTHYFKQVPNGPTAKFWFRVEDEPSRKCTLCNDNYGYKIKCSFYSCQKFYHITCAKRIGVIRDLQSMRFEINSDDFCPIYCEQHLQGYVIDFGNRIKLYTERKEMQKAAHFTKVHNCYKVQLKNLSSAAKRAKQEEEIRSQLGKQLLIQSYEESSMSLSVSGMGENMDYEMNSSSSESNSATFLAYLENQYKVGDLEVLVEGISGVQIKKEQSQRLGLSTKKNNNNGIEHNLSQGNNRIEEQQQQQPIKSKDEFEMQIQGQGEQYQQQHPSQQQQEEQKNNVSPEMVSEQQQQKGEFDKQREGLNTNTNRRERQVERVQEQEGLGQGQQGQCPKRQQGEMSIEYIYNQNNDNLLQEGNPEQQQQQVMDEKQSQHKNRRQSDNSPQLNQLGQGQYKHQLQGYQQVADGRHVNNQMSNNNNINKQMSNNNNNNINKDNNNNSNQQLQEQFELQEW